VHVIREREKGKAQPLHMLDSEALRPRLTKPGTRPFSLPHYMDTYPLALSLSLSCHHALSLSLSPVTMLSLSLSLLSPCFFLLLFIFFFSFG